VEQENAIVIGNAKTLLKQDFPWGGKKTLHLVLHCYELLIHDIYLLNNISIMKSMIYCEVYWNHPGRNEQSEPLLFSRANDGSYLWHAARGAL